MHVFCLCVPQIPVLGIPKRVFRLLLEFLYTDSVDPRIAPEMAHDVLVASMLYSLPRLARLAEVSGSFRRLCEC
jgi:BTB/POZ domain